MITLKTIGTALVLLAAFGAEAMAVSELERAQSDGGALGRISLLVVDDRGQAVADAHVVAGFYSTPKPTARTGDTDKGGTFVCEGKSQSDVRFTIEKEGYYRTSKVYDFLRNAPSKLEPVTSGKWVPWNPVVTVILKKIRHPVPMHAKTARAIRTPCDQALGFDFEVGDSAAPLGKGEVSDVVFHVARAEEAGGEDYKWSLSFSNSMDGVQVLEADLWSKFGAVYEAPEAGYQNRYRPPEKPAQAYTPTSSEVKMEYYVLRVRTKVDAKGQVVSANYAKMSAPVMVGGSKEEGCWLTFSYWYNPDGTRNLEFDPKKNLIHKLRGGDSRLYQP